MAKAVTATSVPPGTETPEWIEMSAYVAERVWFAWLSEETSVDSTYSSERWKSEAADFRIDIRYVLRQLEKEGIRLRKCYDFNGFAPDSEEWRNYSARFAWLLWLRLHRKFNSADEGYEAILWKAVAEQQRKKIRHALSDLANSEIRFLLT
jgi:hypothetical protein